jgi:hypothetical protein
MPLPHFTQLQTTDVNNEALYPSLFEITFVLPTILQAEGRDPLMLLENATNIKLPLTPDIDYKTQQFKFSTRAYMTLPGQTHVDFDINFNVNVNADGSVFVWNTLRSWYDLVWNSQDGSTCYKRDIVGTVIVNHHDRKGEIVRRVTYHNAQIRGIADIDLDWTKSTDIIENVNAKFVSDYWTDEFIDNNYEITPGNVNG